MERDDNTLDNAGEVGRRLADNMSEKAIEAIDGFPSHEPKQKPAIARIVARNLDTWADEVER